MHADEKQAPDAIAHFSAVSKDESVRPACAPTVILLSTLVVGHVVQPFVRETAMAAVSRLAKSLMLR